MTLYDRNEKVSRILAADIPAVDLVIKLDIIRFMRLTSWVLFDIDCLFSFWFSLPNCIFLQLSLGFMLLETHSSGDTTLGLRVDLSPYLISTVFPSMIVASLI